MGSIGEKILLQLLQLLILLNLLLQLDIGRVKLPKCQAQLTREFEQCIGEIPQLVLTLQRLAAGEIQPLHLLRPFVEQQQRACYQMRIQNRQQYDQHQCANSHISKKHTQCAVRLLNFLQRGYKQ
ncbi:hypothetical protein D3C73_1095700 [compost metagenome]